MNKMRRTWIVLVTVTGMTLALSGCRTTPSGTGEDLAPGSTITTAAGVAIGAPQGAIQESVGLTVDLMVKPPQSALPDGAKAVGDAFELTTARAVQTPANAPLLVGLPIPPGASRDHLALAVFVPADRVDYDLVGIDDGIRYAPGDSWSLVPGQVDDSHDLLVALLGSVPTGGQVLRLVESPEVDSPPVAPQRTEAAQAVTLGFVARCAGFAVLDRNRECTASDEAAASQELENVYQDIRVGQGFKDPYLRMEVAIHSLFPAVVAELNYIVELRPFRTEDDYDGVCKVNARGAGNHGRYSFSDRNIVVCFGAPVTTTFDAGRVDTMRHEYFHATQYPYTTSATSWFKESTAVTAQDSLASFVRDTGRDPRDVDVEVMAKPQMYQLQDFWIYLGQRYGLALSDLIPFLQAGGNAAAIDHVLSTDATFAGIETFGDAYWAWSKNQTFEKQVPLGGAGFATTCGLDLNRRGEAVALADGSLPHVLRYTVAAPPGALTVVLAPLSSAVYRIDLSALSGSSYQATPRVTASDPDIRVKFFDASDLGTLDCVSRPETSSRSISVSANQDQTWYVLISNAGTDGNAAFTLGFGAATPSVDITSPREGSRFDEGDTIAFRAIGRGFQGADPADIYVHWTYQDYRDVTVSLGTTQGDDVLAVDRLCDGSYTVTATAFQSTGGRGATDQVSLQVTQPSSPPPNCAPSVSITGPDDGAVFTLGSSVSFTASIDDDHPETTSPVFPLTWRDGGPSGTILAQDTVSFSTAALAEGVHTIYVSYGNASDQIGINIVDTNNTAPNATIASPGDRVSLMWEPYYDGASGMNIPVSGTGSDAEDASVTLTWSSREEGTATWYEFGSGTNATWHLPIVSPKKTYELRLVAKDSGGLTGQVIHTITIIGPPT